MSYTNGILHHDDSHGQCQIGRRWLPGLPGPKGDKGDPGNGYNLTSDGNYDIQNKKLVNVGQGTNNNDVVIKSQIQLLDSASPGLVVNDKAIIYSDSRSVHAQNLYLKDAPEDGLSNEIRIPTQHQSYNNIHLTIPDLKNFDGFGGRRPSEVMITRVDQTVIGKKTFQNIEVPTPTSNSNPTTKKYVDDLPNKKLDKINLNNINLNNTQFTNLGYDTKNPGDVVNLGFTDQKYVQIVSNSDLDLDEHRVKNSLQPINSRDLTTKNYVDNELSTKSDLSKTTTQTFQGRVQVPNFNSESHAGSDIVNLKYINETCLNKKSGGTMYNPITFSSSLPDNKKQIFNLGEPQYNSSAASKAYVDSEILKIQSINTVLFLKIDGTRSMIANLNLGGNKITNLRSPTNNEDAASKSYIDGEIAKISNVDTASYLKIDGSRAMTGDLNMGGNKITNLKTPTGDTDAASKSYIDKTLAESHLVSSSKTNAFVYIDLDDTSSEYNIIVNAFTNNFRESPHKKNPSKSLFKKTLEQIIIDQEWVLISIHCLLEHIR